MSINGIHSQGHYWEGSVKDQICLDVLGHGYMTFDDLDSCVTWLWFNDLKELAREVNKAYNVMSNPKKRKTS